MAPRKVSNTAKRLKKAKKLEATKPLKPTMGDIVVTKPTDVSAP
jgi:hypothetical protein